ncbi:MAG: hypothetical protein E6G37_09725 [Actinobacteria bacterium]|nr:MAG: hypothetical protein E6G37_09725 [Actinomycetota bacterium]
MSTIAEEVEVLRGARSATFKDLLTHRAFARLLAAMSVSSFGDWVGFVAVTAIVANLGGGTALLAVAGVMIARTLPAFLFGPIAGTLVDRLDRKRLMIIADLARGAMYLSMVFLRELWAIYLLSFAIECLSLVWGPARDASLPNLVPRRQLANANSLVLLSAYATLPIGGAAFAVLTAVSIWMGGRIPALATQPESLALLLDAGTFLFSASMVAGIPIRPQPSHSTERLTLSRVWRDTKDGINFLRENSIASAMTGGIVVAFGAVGAVLAIGPVFVTSTLEAGPSGWGLVVTAFGVGMGLGMATAGQAAKVVEREIVFVWSLVAAAAALFVLATMPNLSWAIVFTVWLGAFCGLAWVSGYTLLQENVVDEFRGRTFGSLTTLSRMVLFLSLAAFPTLAQGFDQHQALAQAVPSVATRPAHPRAQTQATSRHRPVHRLRRRRGRRQGHADLDGRGPPAVARSRRPRHPRTRGHGRGRADPRAPARSGDRQAGCPSRGLAVRRLPRTDRGQRDPAGAGGGQGRDLRPVRGLVARLSRVGARVGRARRLVTERLGDPGVVPGYGDPVAPGARARDGTIRGRAARSDGAGGTTVPREGRGRVPQDRGRTSGAVRRG